MKKPIYLGLEEEVFITDPDRPSLQSLYYLARLLWRNPRYYYTRSASNFARGRDIGQGLMGGVEIATLPCPDPDLLVDELAARRRELAGVTQGLIVPVGHLFETETPSNTCGLHVHVGPVDNPRRLHTNLLHFLPLLAALSVHAPFAGGAWQGVSYRMQRSFAIGPVRDDWEYRFQDLIHAKRVGTIEIRAFDPFPDLERLRWLLKAIAAIAAIEEDLPADPVTYNQLRMRVTREGYIPALRPLYRELAALCPLPETLLLEPPAASTAALRSALGTVGAYAALDRAYRRGIAPEAKAAGPAQLPAGPHPAKVVAGVLGYYLVKAPYVLLKARQEW